MAAVITELADFGMTAFFDNRTWLNQENWQAYFGGSLPSGVVVEGKLGANGQYYNDSLTLRTVNESYKAFNAGTIIANGIFAKYTANTYIPVVKSTDVDRLIVARVYILSGAVKIVGKTKIASDNGYTPSVFATMLLQSESTGCIRNDTYFEIPLAYEIYGAYSYDLRRLYYLPSKANPFLEVAYNGTTASVVNPDMGVLYGQGFVQVYGGMNYDIQIASGDTTNSLSIYPVPACSEKPTVIYVKNNSNTEKQIRLPILAKSLTYSYEWIDNWDTEEGSGSYKYRELVAQDKLAIILTPFKSGSSFGYTVSSKGMSEGIDPDDYYTKQEMTVLLGQKVSQAYVDAGLALKADSADLGDLAYQDTANYQTQLTNKPTLGALASHDTVSLTSEVTGILPIENGGTGSDTLAGFIDNVVGTVKQFYVDGVNGSDNNDGTTYATAFKTIHHAIGVCPYLAKCTVTISGGAYTESIIVPYGKCIEFLAKDSNITITMTPVSTSTSAITVDGGTLSIGATGSNYAQWIITGSCNCGIVEVVNGGQLISPHIAFGSISITNSHTKSGSNDTVSGLYLDNNGCVNIGVSTTIQCTSTGAKGDALLVQGKSRCSINTLSVSGRYGIYNSQGDVSIYTLSITSATEKGILSSGGVVTYGSLSGVSTTTTSAGGRIYTGSQS